MEAALIGVATSFNFIVILVKFNRGRFLDAILDIGIFIAIASLFTGTISGMSVGMVASAIVSIYLWFNQPTFFKSVDSSAVDDFIAEFKSKL